MNTQRSNNTKTTKAVSTRAPGLADAIPGIKQMTVIALGRRVWTITCLLGISLLLAGPAGAQTNASSAGPLRVGISPVFPPMAFKQQRELAGVEVDLARQLGQHLGREVVFVELPWADQIEALTSGKTDIIMSSMSITAARRYVVSFTRPYFLVGQMALVRREDRNRYMLGFPLNLPGPPGVLRATTGEFLVQRDFPKAKRKVFDNPTQAVAALKKGKIDLFVSDSTLVWYLAGMHAADGLAVVPAPLSEEQLAWAAARGNDDLVAAANAFIERSLQDGSLRKVFRRWGATGD